MENGESLYETAIREVKEETGLHVAPRDFDTIRQEWFVTNNIIEGKHYVGLFVVCDWVSGEPKNLEPKKNEGWEWVTYDKLLEYSKPGDAWLPSEFLIGYQNKILKY